ncbi:MAG: hypothetical protein R3B47_21055 [Bacteroidia bacterium]
MRCLKCGIALPLVQNQLDNYEEQIAVFAAACQAVEGYHLHSPKQGGETGIHLAGFERSNEAQAVRLEQAAILQAADFEFFRVKNRARKLREPASVTGASKC